MKTITGKRLVALVVIMILGFLVYGGLISLYHADATLNEVIRFEVGPNALHPNEKLPFGCWVSCVGDRTYRVQIWDGRSFSFTNNGEFLFYDSKPVFYEGICSIITILLSSGMIFISEKKFV